MFVKKLIRKLYYFSYFRKFKKYGKNIHLSKNGSIVRPNEIIFGNNIFINRNFHISARSLVFGDNIMIGPNLVIECDNHIYNKAGYTMFEISQQRDVKGVTIENDIWIGANVVILPGVKIGEGSIIGAGSVVTKSIPPYSICVGVPCCPKKRRFSDSNLKKHLKNVNSDYKSDMILDIYNDNNI